MLPNKGAGLVGFVGFGGSNPPETTFSSFKAHLGQKAVAKFQADVAVMAGSCQTFEGSKYLSCLQQDYVPVDLGEASSRTKFGTMLGHLETTIRISCWNGCASCKTQWPSSLELCVGVPPHGARECRVQ